MRKDRVKVAKLPDFDLYLGKTKIYDTMTPRITKFVLYPIQICIVSNTNLV